MTKAASLRAVLELDKVTYAYPGTGSGVSTVSLSVEPGTIYGLLGVNGAGKTTLMRLMIGLLIPDSGSITHFGQAHWQREMLGSIGSLIEVPSLYGHLTAREHLKVFAHYTAASPAAVGLALEVTGMEGVADRRVRQLSLGMKQRLGIATALLHDPPMLVLDEPTNGLDPIGIVATRELMKRLAGDLGKTIIVSSHLLSEVEKTATRIGIIHQGRMRFEGTPETLSARLGVSTELRVRVASPDAAMQSLARAGVSGRTEGETIAVDAPDDAAAAAVIRALAHDGIDVYEAVRQAGSLERDFLRLTGSDTDAR